MSLPRNISESGIATFKKHFVDKRTMPSRMLVNALYMNKYLDVMCGVFVVSDGAQSGAASALSVGPQRRLSS